MKQNISGPVGIGVIIVVAVAVCAFLYMRFVHETTLDPKVLEESKAGIQKTTDRLRAAGINPGGAPNTAPPSNSKGTDAPAGAGK